MSNKTIILFLVILLTLSCVFLAYTQTKQQSPESQNWWVIYFVSPKDDSLNFMIENNSDQSNFHYEILADKDRIKEENVEIGKGEKKEIAVNAESADNNKIAIRVNAGDEKKEIYKNFGK